MRKTNALCKVGKKKVNSKQLELKKSEAKDILEIEK